MRCSIWIAAIAAAFAALWPTNSLAVTDCSTCTAACSEAVACDPVFIQRSRRDREGLEEARRLRGHQLTDSGLTEQGSEGVEKDPAVRYEDFVWQGCNAY